MVRVGSSCQWPYGACGTCGHGRRERCPAITDHWRDLRQTNGSFPPIADISQRLASAPPQRPHATQVNAAFDKNDALALESLAELGDGRKRRTFVILEAEDRASVDA